MEKDNEYKRLGITRTFYSVFLKRFFDIIISFMNPADQRKRTAYEAIIYKMGKRSGPGPYPAGISETAVCKDGIYQPERPVAVCIYRLR